MIEKKVMQTKRPKKWVLQLFLGLTSAIFICGIAGAQEVPAGEAKSGLAAARDLDGGEDLSGLLTLPFEELLDIEVTLVSKQKEKYKNAPAAIFVLTQEDIRRSGATNLPEALRRAPGLNVGQIDSHTWAVSARGFNNEFANKLLVMIDGRTVYTPLFSGVFWDMQDVMLEDVEQIEVIRGPGGTLWGSNAVNGIINIITKKTADTQGLLLSGGGGNIEQGFGSVRYGGKLGQNGYYRIYSKYFNRGDFVLGGGDDSVDAWDKVQGGFRMDWSGTEMDSFTLQGDIFKGAADSEPSISTLSGFPTPTISTVTFEDALNMEGGNILGRWSRVWSERSDMTLQFYYDHTKRDNIMFGEIRNTIDFDFQHRFDLSSTHQLMWGLGYHLTRDDFAVGPYFAFDPANRDLHLYSGFVQDTINLVDDTLQLSLGTKFEHNDFTGFEFQPSSRLLWKVHEYHSIWGGITRAVRTPARGDHNVRINIPYDFGGGMAGLYRVWGDDGTKSEDLIAYELGYRIKQDEKLYVEFSTFYNSYDNLVTVAADDVLLPGGPGEAMIAPHHTENEASGETYGVEVAANYKITENWQLSPGYSYIREQLEVDEFESIGSFATAEGNTARNQFNLRSLINVSENVELDTYLYYVDNLPSLDISSYLRLDVRLGWQITDSMELSLVGQNLIDDQHGEFTSLGSQGVEVPRSFYAKLTWRF